MDMQKIKTLVIGLTFILIVMPIGLFESIAGELPKCLFVASYHKGYAWQDGAEKGLRAILDGKCEVKQFDMDTKRNPSPQYCEAKALEAKKLIEIWQPDIVIAIDDNASKYLVAPYLKDGDIPVVFSGINWTAEEYGFPYTNATGMIEVAPIRPLVESIKEIIPYARNGILLTTSHLSSQKNAQRIRQYTQSLGINIEIVVADSMNEFEHRYVWAQDYDFIVIFSSVVIPDWDEIRARRVIAEHSKKLTVTIEEFMMPYVMLGITNVAEEQGEYAAQIAMMILGGVRPADIPVIANRRWHTYVNTSLIDRAGVKIPARVLRQAIKFSDWSYED